MSRKDDAEIVAEYYRRPEVIEHYADATRRIGLWVSEEKIFRRVFGTDESILELGCGTGRIAIGLAEVGFGKLIGVDPSKKMVGEARRMARLLGHGISFQTGSATALDFEDELFDGIIFGFNGLMQIPKRANRRTALAEAFRVLRPGKFLVFTTHDRGLDRHRNFWTEEKKRWERGEQAPELFDFGDRYEPTELGDLFIHVPTREDVIEDLKGAGFKLEADVMRSHVADEPLEVREFSDECRFWVARKPEG